VCWRKGWTQTCGGWRRRQQTAALHARDSNERVFTLFCPRPGMFFRNKETERWMWCTMLGWNVKSWRSMQPARRPCRAGCVSRCARGFSLHVVGHLPSYCVLRSQEIRSIRSWSTHFTFIFLRTKKLGRFGNLSFVFFSFILSVVLALEIWLRQQLQLVKQVPCFSCDENFSIHLKILKS